MSGKPLPTGSTSPVSGDSAAPVLRCAMCDGPLDWTPTKEQLSDGAEPVCKPCFDSLPPEMFCHVVL